MMTTESDELNEWGDYFHYFVGFLGVDDGEIEELESQIGENRAFIYTDDSGIKMIAFDLSRKLCGRRVRNFLDGIKSDIVLYVIIYSDLYEEIAFTLVPNEIVNFIADNEAEIIFEYEK